MHKLIYIIFSCFCFTGFSQSVPYINYTSDDGLPSSSISSIYQDESGYIWIGTSLGVSRFNGSEFENFYSSEIHNDAVTHFKEDASNTLYFSTRNEKSFLIVKDSIQKHNESIAGTTIVEKNKQIQNPFIKEQLKDFDLVEVLIDRENSVWVATKEAGLFYFPYYPNLKSTYPSIITSSISTSKDNILIAKKDSLWFFDTNDVAAIATTIKYDSSIKEGVVFENRAIYFNGDFVYHLDKEILNNTKKVSSYLLTKHKEHLYIYDTDRTVYKVTFSTQSSTKIDLKKDQKLSSMGFDNQGNLWGGYQNEIVPLEISASTKSEPIPIKGTPAFIKSTSYFDLIIATQSDGVLFKKEDTIFSSEPLVLQHKIINSLYIDDSQTLWVATNAGLFRLNNDDITSIDQFTTKNGLLSNDVNAVTTFNNELYVATKKGISVLTSTRLSANKASEVIFPYVRLDNEKIIPVSKKLTVAAKYSYITIKFLALNYKSKGAITYRYKIDGIHKDWVETQEPKVQFTFLPSGGDYIFEIMAQNEDGLWGPSSTLELEFLIPFYKSWWFYTLLAILLILISWKTVVYFYKRKLKIQSYKADLQALESKALQSQMNQHFVFNSLNSIQSFIATGDILNSEIYLAKFSKLLRKTLNNSSVSTYSLSKEIEHLELYLELEKLRFGEKLNHTITIDDSLEVDLIEITPMLIQPFIENAIIHGITPKKEGGSISISILPESANTIKCVVEDNGVGRQKNKNKIHPSLGTDIVLKRLDLLSNSAIQNIDYVDLKDEDGKPTGTKVTFLIPIYD